jgi:hypothetical protein
MARKTHQADRLICCEQKAGGLYILTQEDLSEPGARDGSSKMDRAAGLFVSGIKRRGE